MVPSWMMRGRAEGRAEEAVLLIKRQLARRFGSLPAAVSQSIEELPIEAAEQLAEDLLDFTCLEDLVGWLGQQQSKKDTSDS